MHPDMTLPFALPVPLAACRPVDRVPTSGEMAAEPKLDGWRCQVLAGSGRIWSRHATELTSRFDDVAQASRSLPPCVLDGELVAVLDDGTISFGSLQSRSPRGRRRGEDFSVHLAVFDVLAVDEADLRRLRYSERRRHLLELLDTAPASIRPVPVSHDVSVAQGWVGALGGVEGIVMKPDRPYAAGLASGWLKWRQTHSTEAVVLGVSGRSAGTQCLVLGRPDRRGQMRAVGVSLPVAPGVRRELAAVLQAVGEEEAELPGVVGGLPGGDPVRYRPVVPEVVVEIETDQVALEFGRYRHRPRVRRVRGDLRPEDLAIPQ